MQFVHCGDTLIHYRAIDCGSGKPVIVFVNSLGTDFRIWDAVVEARIEAITEAFAEMRDTGQLPLKPATFQAAVLAALLLLQ